jgi:hypothetical protein
MPASVSASGGLAAREEFELELIGRDHVGGRKRAIADELGHAAAHVQAAAGVADHRIAAIARGWIGALDPPDGLDHRLSDIGGGNIARDHSVALAQHTALVDALDHHADGRAAEDAPAPAAVAGMVRILNRVDRPHLDADALQREYGGGIADMAIGDVGLDGQKVHRTTMSNSPAVGIYASSGAGRRAPSRRQSPLIRPASISSRLKRRASAPSAQP